MDNPVQIWQIQQAKAQLCSIVWQSQIKPQVITKHGKAKAVMVSYQLFRSMIAAMHESNQRAALVEAEKSGLTSQNAEGAAEHSGLTSQNTDGNGEIVV